MGSDTAASFSVIASQKASNNCDEIFMQHRLHFADSLKELKNLRQQLYSAAEYFESSYEKDDHKQSVIDSSKDYASQALVSTVDHLGSVADKLNKFLAEKTDEIFSTDMRFYCIERRLNTSHGFVNLQGVSGHSLASEAPKHHKQYNLQGVQTSYFRKSNLDYTDCVSCPQNETRESKQENPFMKEFQVAVIKPQPPLLRKGGESRSYSTEVPPNPVNFLLTRILSTKETGQRSNSPPRFTLKRSDSVAYQPKSPGSSINKHQTPSEPGRLMITTQMKQETTKNRERQIISYTKRTKNLLKALLSIHHSRKESSRSG